MGMSAGANGSRREYMISSCQGQQPNAAKPKGRRLSSQDSLVIQQLVTSDGTDGTQNYPGHLDNEWE